MKQTRAAIEFLMPSIGAAVSGILNAYKKNSDDLNNIGRDSSTNAMQSAGQKSNNSDYKPSADQDPDSGAALPQGQRLKDVMEKAQSGESQAIPSAAGGDSLGRAASADAMSGNPSTGVSGGSSTQGNLVGGYGNDLTHSGTGQSLGGGSAPTDGSSSSPSSSSQSNANSYGQIAGALASAYGSAQSGAPAAQLPQAGGGAGYTPTAQAAMAGQAPSGQSQSLADLMKKYQQYGGGV